jgi:hypothetical protein
MLEIIQLKTKVVGTVTNINEAAIGISYAFQYVYPASVTSQAVF